jgi:hypothetical protein
MPNRAGLLLIALAVVPCAARAQVPAGPEFRVNTFTTGFQGGPSAASDPNGNFVVTWAGDTDGYGAGVFGQRFSASGAPLGIEFRVNTFTTNLQGSPTVAAHANGDFVVAWTSGVQDGSDFGIFGQRFNAAGAPVGAEFPVNTFTLSAQTNQSIAAGTGGDFVVVWQSYGQDGSSYGVFAQRFSPSGPVGGEFRVNTTTASNQRFPSIASDASGNFVVVWQSLNQDGSSDGIFGQRFAASGAPVGVEFAVNAFTTSFQRNPAVVSDANGNFLVAWESLNQDGSDFGVFGQRFDAAGVPVGSEFGVNTFTASAQHSPSAAVDANGNFVVAWTSFGQDGDSFGVFGQRFGASGAPVGIEFQANTFTAAQQESPAVASDASGNFVVAWQSVGQDGSIHGVFGQRFGGLHPAALAVDTVAGPSSNGNGVLEPGELDAGVRPSWRNINGAAQVFAGTLSDIAGPAGATHTITDPAADYGTVANAATAPCTDCYGVSLTAATRPVRHWDATALETIAPVTHSQTKRWTLHVGDSFADVPRSNTFYRFVETLLHHGVTSGCTATQYCPASTATRREMAVFVLSAKEGAGYAPPACAPPNVFADVPETSPFCPFIEELARRGVVSGCGSGNYCPATPVTRAEMAIFVLLTLDPAMDPPACSPPNTFSDVPETSIFCRWIEELARRGVVTGCAPGTYCPGSPVTRAQMGVFLSNTFGLLLYGP